MRRQNILDEDRNSMLEMCQMLEVDADKAWDVYESAVRAGKLQGRDAVIIQGAAILITARRTGAPVTIDEIATLTGKRKWLLGKSARMIVGDDLPGARYEEFVARGARKLDLPDEVRCLVDAVSAEVRSDMSPPVRAAVVLYTAARRAGLKIDRKRVGEAVGVNNAGLRLYVKHGGVLMPGVAAK